MDIKNILEHTGEITGKNVEGKNLTDMGNPLDKSSESEKGIQDIRQIPALTLAYLGDAIYELIIRTRLVNSGMSHVDSLNKKASGYAKAPTQAKIYHVIEDALSEEEKGYFKRGRNAKSGSVAKSGTVNEYRIATGFEAMLGFLFLSGRTDRIMELVDIGIMGLEK